jgi:hypothetical protein
MARKSGLTWFVVADGSCAKLLAAIPGRSEFRILAQYESKEARFPSRELVSTPPSRVQESANAARHAVGPRRDPHTARKAAFARDIAAHLKAAGERGDYQALVLMPTHAPLRSCGRCLIPQQLGVSKRNSLKI